MNMAEIVNEVSFMLGLPANDNIEKLNLENAVTIAFRELKRYIKTPTNKTVPYATRIDLVAQGIKTNKVLGVIPSQPKIGMKLTSLQTGNVFELAAAVNVSTGLGQGSTINLDPIMTELALSQVRNCLATDFQWNYDLPNQVVYCTHNSPLPATVTIQYVPDFEDVSELQNPTWVDYLVRMSLANAKIALGRSRSKYRIEGSNVTLDGETLLNEGNTELETIRNELGPKRSKLVVLN